MPIDFPSDDPNLRALAEQHNLAREDLMRLSEIVLENQRRIIDLEIRCATLTALLHSVYRHWGQSVESMIEEGARLKTALNLPGAVMWADGPYSPEQMAQMNDLIDLITDGLDYSSYEKGR